MTFSQLAIHNITRNKRMYAAHFWSSTFSVLMFFTYSLLLFHPDLNGKIQSSSETLSELGLMGLRVSQVLLIVFSFFFILYSVGSFLKTRNKEFGILIIHGMSPKQFRKLVFMENMLIGCASIVAGVLLGVIFSKLILSGISELLAIDKGLTFYVPLKAIGTTFIAFLILFLLISIVTTRMVRVNQLINLLKGSDKPKPEPKASIGLSVLAVLLVGAGYATVFSFATGITFSFLVLLSGVVLTVVGTYFLFTQFAVFALRMLKKSERLYFKKTNLLTLSELGYRLKDNSRLFFIVAVISAVAFTAIGTCTAIGNQGLAEMTNPYAFTYYSYQGNKQEQADVSLIKQKLEQSQLPYRVGAATLKFAGNDVTVMNLSDYNKLAIALGYEQEAITADNEAFLVPTSVMGERVYSKEGFEEVVQLIEDTTRFAFQVMKAVPHQVLPQDYGVIRLVVVTDDAYEQIPDRDESGQGSYTVYGFAVEHWSKLGDTTEQLMKQLNTDQEGEQSESMKFQFRALYPQWVAAKQANGLLLLVSVLIGVVFFTFAASFLYFRLYTDRSRDQQQTEMLSKMGLTRKELNRVVTRQLLVMFFLPLLIAILHSGVAFAALQQLVHFSVGESTIKVLVSFTVVQIIYFFVIRWRYVQQLRIAMV